MSLIKRFQLHILTIFVLLLSLSSYTFAYNKYLGQRDLSLSREWVYRRKFHLFNSEENYEGISEKEKLARSLKNARNNLERKVSPGGGLSTAEEQADAAYADLINTSMTQTNKEDLDENELEDLAKGGKMWERGSLDRKNKLGFLGDFLNVVEALSGGAHIVKDKYGRT